MIEIDYKIDIWSTNFNFIPPGIITIATVNTISTLSDIELLDYTTDSLTHEFLHALLYDLFNDTVCGLFDAIEQHFRATTLLEKLYATDKDVECYHTFIKRRGFKAFLEDYHISENNFNQAYIICNERLK